VCCPPQVTNVNNDKVNALIVSNIKAGRRYGVYFADLIKMSEFVYASNMLVAGAPCNYSELLRLVSLGKCNPKTHGASMHTGYVSETVLNASVRAVPDVQKTTLQRKLAPGDEHAGLQALSARACLAPVGCVRRLSFDRRDRGRRHEGRKEERNVSRTRIRSFMIVRLYHLTVYLSWVNMRSHGQWRAGTTRCSRCSKQLFK
jgi:hypothetical protein